MVPCIRYVKPSNASNHETPRRSIRCLTSVNLPSNTTQRIPAYWYSGPIVSLCKSTGCLSLQILTPLNRLLDHQLLSILNEIKQLQHIMTFEYFLTKCWRHRQLLHIHVKCIKHKHARHAGYFYRESRELIALRIMICATMIDLHKSHCDTTIQHIQFLLWCVHWRVGPVMVDVL